MNNNFQKGQIVKCIKPDDDGIGNKLVKGKKYKIVQCVPNREFRGGLLVKEIGAKYTSGITGFLWFPDSFKLV